MANARNIMLGYPNRIDGCALSGGAWTLTLPLANLQNRLFARVARSQGLAPAQATYTMDLGQPRAIRLFAHVAHNHSVTARIRLEASDAPTFVHEIKPPVGTPPGASLRLDFLANVGWRRQPFTVIYDETFDAWGSATNADWRIDQLEWESDNFWLGTYTAEEIEGITAVAQHVLPQDVVARYWRVTIDDPDNVDGYAEIGRVFLGGVIQPAINYAWGGSLGYEFGTSVETALGGAEFFDVREGVRVMRFTLQYMADDEAFGRFLELVRRAGVHSEMMVIPDPADLVNGIRRNFMGRLREISPLEQMTWMNGGSAHSMAFEIKELR